MSAPSDLAQLRAIAEAATPGAEWRVVPDSPAYLVSDRGHVWSSFSNRLLALTPHPSGHLYVKLGRRRTAQVHRLVLTAFVGQPRAGQEGCHWNGDPTDNRIENLRWGTRGENAAEAKVAAVEALADEWEGTVYKLPSGYPMTVNTFCHFWFTEPLRAALATGDDS